MPTCGSSSTKGIVITIQAIIISTYAVSKYSANTASLDGSCQQYFQLPEPEDPGLYESTWEDSDADGVEATTETSLGLGFGDKVALPGRVKPLPLALHHRASSNVFGPKAGTKRTINPSKSLPTQSRIPAPRPHFVTQPTPHSTKHQPHSAFIAPDSPTISFTNTVVGNNQNQQHQELLQAAKPAIQAAPAAPQPQTAPQVQLTAPQPAPQAAPQTQPSTPAPATETPQSMPQGLAPQPQLTAPQPVLQAAPQTQPATAAPATGTPQLAPQPLLTAPQPVPMEQHAVPQPALITVQEQQPVQQPQAAPGPQLVQPAQPDPQHVAQQPLAQAQPILPSEPQQTPQGTHATLEHQTLNLPAPPLSPTAAAQEPIITGGHPAPTAPASPVPDSTSKPAATQPIQGLPLETPLPSVGHPQIVQPTPTASAKSEQQLVAAPEQNTTVDHLSRPEEPHTADALKPQASTAPPVATPPLPHPAQNNTEPDISIAAPQPVNSREAEPVRAEEPKAVHAQDIQPVTAQHPTQRPADAQETPTGQIDLNNTTPPSQETKQAPAAHVSGPSGPRDPIEEPRSANTSSPAGSNISQALPSATGHASDQQAHTPDATDATPEHTHDAHHQLAAPTRSEDSSIPQFAPGDEPGLETLHQQAAPNPATHPTAEPLHMDLERHKDPHASELLHEPPGLPAVHIQPTMAKPSSVLKASQLWMLEDHATDLFDVLKYSTTPADKARASIALSVHHSVYWPETDTMAGANIYPSQAQISSLDQGQGAPPQPLLGQQANTAEDDFTTRHPPHGRLLMEQSEAQRKPATDPKPKPTPQARVATQSGYKSSAARQATGRRAPAASGSPAKARHTVTSATKPMMPWLHTSPSTRQSSTLVRKQQYNYPNQEGTQHHERHEEPARHGPLYDEPSQTGGRDDDPTWLHRVREEASEREDSHKDSSRYDRMHEEDNEHANSQEEPERYDHRREESWDHEDWREESMQNDRLRGDYTEHESHYRDSRQYEDLPQHEDASEEAREHDDDEDFPDRHNSRQYMTSSYFGGRATIIQGVITSVAGLGDDASYEGGTMEYVAAFEGASLSVAEYEALPQQTPQITPGVYKIELTEE